MAGLFPLSRMQQSDSNGNLLSGARLFLFDGGTSTPRIAYRDLALTSAHPNPIVADGAGRLPLIYLDDGFYRQRLTTSTGVLIFDDDGIPVLTTSAGGAGTTVDPDATLGTRDIKIRFDDQPISGFVRLNGKTIGSATSGATERANADTQSLFEELWEFANISVVSGKGATAAADWAANKALTLPDCQGRSLFGLPDMGGTANSAFAALLSGTDTDEPGATGGANTVTLAQANVPSYSLTGGSGTVSASGTTGNESNSHTHSVSGTTGDDPGDHTHSVNVFNTFNAAEGAGANVLRSTTGGTTQSGNPDRTHTHSFSATSGSQSTNHTHTVTVTGTASSVSISSGGSGTAVNKLPPLMTLMIYIRL